MEVLNKQIELIKMNEKELDDYIKFMIPDFASDLAKNFKKPMEEALKESKKMMDDLFKDGLETKGQYIYHIHDSSTGENVGVLWYFINLETNAAFIYHIYIDEAYRGKGYGKVSLQDMELIIKEQGAKTIGLNVFGHNETALNLYKKLGYNVSAISMDKTI